MRLLLSVLILNVLTLSDISIADSFSLNQSVLESKSEWNFDEIRAVSVSKPYCALRPRALGCGNDCFIHLDSPLVLYNTTLLFKNPENELGQDLVEAFKRDLENTQQQWRPERYQNNFEDRTAEIFRKVLERIEQDQKVAR